MTGTYFIVYHREKDAYYSESKDGFTNEIDHITFYDLVDQTPEFEEAQDCPDESLIVVKDVSVNVLDTIYSPNVRQMTK